MKPKNRIAVTVLSAVMVFAGCLSSGRLTVVIPPETRYDAAAQVLVVMKRSDPIDIQDNLEHRLVKAGFVVKPNLSPDLARKLLNEQKRNAGQLPVYTLEYDYLTRRTMILQRLVFEKFSAKLVRVQDRKVFMDARFQGSRAVEGFLEELVEKMGALLPQ